MSEAAVPRETKTIYRQSAVSFGHSTIHSACCQLGGLLVSSILRPAACLLMVGAFLQLEVAATAQEYYTYHPMSIMSLGMGFSPNDLSRANVRCVNYEPDLLDPAGLGSTLSLKLISTSTHLKAALELDAKVDASYLVYSGGAYFNLDQSFLRDESSITVVLNANTEFGRLAMKNVKLTPEAQALLDQHLVKDFKQRCGSRVISIERRGVMAAVLITLRNVDDDTRNAIKAGLQFSGGSGPLTVSAKTAFQSEMERASHEGRVDVQVVSTGGEGFGTLSELIRALTNKSATLEAIGEALANYIKQFKKDNAAPIGFFASPMPGLESIEDEPWTDLKEKRLEIITDTYRRVRSSTDELRSIARGDDPRTSLINATARDQITAALPAFDEFLDKLALAHSACKHDLTVAGAACNLPSGEPALPSAMPKPILRPLASFRVVADNKLWNKLESRAVFGNPTAAVADGQTALGHNDKLLERVRAYRSGVSSAFKVLLIEGSYLASVAVYVELSGAIRDDLKSVQPYLANFWSRSQLPKQPLSCTFDHDQASLLLESGQPGFDIPDVQSRFEAEVYAGVVSQTSGKGAGSGIVYASIQDLFGNKTRIDLIAFSWTYSPETRLLILDISASSGEPSYTCRSTLRAPGVTLIDELNEAEKKIHEAPIDLLMPASATRGDPAFILKVIGTGFRQDSTVLWNGAVRTTTYVGPSELNAAITAADIAKAGLAAITVTTPGPGGGTSAPATFTIK